MSSCFIDTNIWLYAFIETQNKSEKRKRSLAKKTIQSNEIVISDQVINETCVNLLKKLTNQNKKYDF